MPYYYWDPTYILVLIGALLFSRCISISKQNI